MTPLNRLINWIQKQSPQTKPENENVINSSGEKAAQTLSSVAAHFISKVESGIMNVFT